MKLFSNLTKCKILIKKNVFRVIIIAHKNTKNTKQLEKVIDVDKSNNSFIVKVGKNLVGLITYDGRGF